MIDDVVEEKHEVSFLLDRTTDIEIVLGALYMAEYDVLPALARNNNEMAKAFISSGREQSSSKKHAHRDLTPDPDDPERRTRFRVDLKPDAYPYPKARPGGPQQNNTNDNEEDAPLTSNSAYGGPQQAGPVFGLGLRNVEPTAASDARYDQLDSGILQPISVSLDSVLTIL
jgi:hypothetical protein